MCEYMYSNFVSCASSVSFEKYLSFFRSKRVNAFTVTIVFIVSYAKPKRFSWNCSNQQPHRNQTHWEPTMARFTWLKGRGRLCSMISIGDHTHRSRMSSNQIAFFEYYSLVQLISIDRRFIFCLLSHWCTISVTHSTSKQQTAHITSHRRAHKFVGKVLVLHWKNPKLACELSKTCTNISLIDRLKNWRPFSLSQSVWSETCSCVERIFRRVTWNTMGSLFLHGHRRTNQIKIACFFCPTSLSMESSNRS